jgi:uncharacterized UPF0160 family protein
LLTGVREKKENKMKTLKEIFEFLKSLKVLKIATHAGVFHADEVVAISLIKHFINENIEVARLPHQTPEEEFEKFDLVVDISKKYDGVKFFDHHQFRKDECPHAAAGLIWKFIKESLKIQNPGIDRLVELVDAQDIGIRKCWEFEFPALISRFNASNVWGEEQNAAFNEAVSFALKMISSLDREQKELDEAAKIVAESSELIPGVVFLKKYTRLWSKFINGQETGQKYEAVVWEDEATGEWSSISDSSIFSIIFFINSFVKFDKSFLSLQLLLNSLKSIFFNIFSFVIALPLCKIIPYFLFLILHKV